MDAYIAGLLNSINSDTKTHDDSELWSRLSQSKNGKMIKDFCEGNYQGYKTNDEQATPELAIGFVLSRLAYVCNFDESQIERVFNTTKLSKQIRGNLQDIIKSAITYTKEYKAQIEQEFTKEPAKSVSQNQTPRTDQQANKQSEPNKNELERKKYSRHSFADFCRNPAPIKYYIKNYIQEQALHMIFGAPGSGKSFVAVDMAASIACPEINNWNGRALKHGPVIYLAGEGVAGLRKRFAGWAAKRAINPENVQLTVIDEAFHLDDDTEEYNINTTIENIREIYQKPAVIFIDTLHVFMNGDENRAQDIGAFLTPCRKLMREFGCSVVLVHHTGVAQEAKDRARGSSALRGAMDIELKISKEKGQSDIKLSQTKNKEAQEEKDLILTLEQFEIPNWYDEEGQPVNTCTIEAYKSNTFTEQGTAKAVKLNKPERTAEQTFKEAILRDGIKIEDKNTGNILAGVYIEDWRKVSYELSAQDNQDTKRNEFNSGRKGLHEKGIILKRVIDGRDYYCVDVSPQGSAEALYKQAVITNLNKHLQTQREAETELTESIE